VKRLVVRACWSLPGAAVQLVLASRADLLQVMQPLASVYRADPLRRVIQSLA
jgi:hypothetical protein